MKKIVLLSIVAIMGFTACQKEQPTIMPDSSSANNTLVGQPIGASGIHSGNPNNPYDSIGYYHNRLLTYFFQNGFNVNTPEDSLLGWTSDFVAESFGVNNFDSIEAGTAYQTIIIRSYNNFTVWQCLLCDYPSLTKNKYNLINLLCLILTFFGNIAYSKF